MLVIEVAGGDSDKLNDRYDACIKFNKDHPELEMIIVSKNDSYRPNLKNTNFKLFFSPTPLEEAIKIVKNTDGVLVTASDSRSIGREALALTRIARVHPIIFGSYPKLEGSFYFGDLGGSVEESIKHWIWLAYAGKILGEVFFDKTPRIGMLNIGQEVGKGGQLEQYRKILDEILNTGNSKRNQIFIGNVELTNISRDNVDVLLSCGLMGNVSLKAAEASVELISQKVRLYAKKNVHGIIFATLFKYLSKTMLRDLDWRKHSGGFVFGYNSPIIKVHGRADKNAFYCAIEKAIDPKTRLLWNTLKNKDNLQVLDQWTNNYIPDLKIPL